MLAVISARRAPPGLAALMTAVCTAATRHIYARHPGGWRQPRRKAAVTRSCGVARAASGTMPGPRGGPGPFRQAVDWTFALPLTMCSQGQCGKTSESVDSAPDVGIGVRLPSV